MENIVSLCSHETIQTVYRWAAIIVEVKAIMENGDVMFSTVSMVVAIRRHVVGMKSIVVLNYTLIEGITVLYL